MSDNILDSILPKIYPFPQITTDDPDKVYASRYALFECPTCLELGNIYNSTCDQGSVFRLLFCKGNQDPHCPCGGDHMVTCAGVLEPHFHLICGTCSTISLLHLPEKK